MRDDRSLTIATLLLAGPVFAVHVAKKWNLSFHTRDYQSYLNLYDAKIATLWDVTRPSNLNATGTNFLGFNGIDGFPYASSDIHLSPVNYLSSALFNLSGEFSLALVFALFASFAVLKVLQSETRLLHERSAQVFALLALPAFIMFATYDLRPFVLLSSVLLLTCLAVHMARSDRVILALVIVGFTAREEGYWIAMMASCHLLALGRLRLAWALAGLAGLYIALAYWAFWNTSFVFHFWGLIVVAIPLIPLAFFATWRHRKGEQIGAALVRLGILPDANCATGMLAWLMIYLAPYWLLLAVVRSPMPPYFMPLMAVVLAASLAWRHARSPVVKFLPAVALCLAFVQDGVRLSGQVWPQDRNRNAQIWKFANELSADARIVTTMGLHQAFWSRHAVVWDRLPATAETRGQNITWPDNRPRLGEYIDQADYLLLDDRATAALADIAGGFADCSQLAGLTFCDRR